VQENPTLILKVSIKGIASAHSSRKRESQSHNEGKGARSASCANVASVEQGNPSIHAPSDWNFCKSEYSSSCRAINRHASFVVE
jgi:hypothetical protein